MTKGIYLPSSCHHHTYFVFSPCVQIWIRSLSCNLSFPLCLDTTTSIIIMPRKCSLSIILQMLFHKFKKLILFYIISWKPSLRQSRSASLILDHIVPISSLILLFHRRRCLSSSIHSVLASSIIKRFREAFHIISHFLCSWNSKTIIHLVRLLMLVRLHECHTIIDQLTSEQSSSTTLQFWISSQTHSAIRVVIDICLIECLGKLIIHSWLRSLMFRIN